LKLKGWIGRTGSLKALAQRRELGKKSQRCEKEEAMKFYAKVGRSVPPISNEKHLPAAFKTSGGKDVRGWKGETDRAPEICISWREKEIASTIR